MKAEPMWLREVSCAENPCDGPPTVRERLAQHGIAVSVRDAVEIAEILDSVTVDSAESDQSVTYRSMYG